MTDVLPRLRGTEVARFIESRAVGAGDPLMAQGYAEAHGWYGTVDVCRALVVPTGQDDLNEGFEPVSNDLQGLLRQRTIIDRLPAALRVPERIRLLTTTSEATATWAAEGTPISAGAASLAALQLTEVRRVGVILPLSEELGRAAASNVNLLNNEAVGPLALAIDRALLDPTWDETDDRPGAITTASTPIASSGTTPAAIDADLKAMLGELIAAGMTLETAVWLTSPAVATHLALLRGDGGPLAYPEVSATGGRLAGLPLLTTLGCTSAGSPGEHSIVLLESSQLAILDHGPRIDVSRQATLQLDDAPADGAQSQLALWQNNLIAIRAERFINWKLRRAGAVSLLTGLTLS